MFGGEGVYDCEDCVWGVGWTGGFMCVSDGCVWDRGGCGCVPGVCVCVFKYFYTLMNTHAHYIRFKGTLDNILRYIIFS